MPLVLVRKIAKAFGVAIANRHKAQKLRPIGSFTPSLGGFGLPNNAVRLAIFDQGSAKGGCPIARFSPGAHDLVEF